MDPQTFLMFSQTEPAELLACTAGTEISLNIPWRKPSLQQAEPKDLNHTKQKPLRASWEKEPLQDVCEKETVL
jgi:hypothetical protein